MILNQTTQEHKSIEYKRIGVLFIMLLSTCIWAGQTESGEYDLLGVLENDLHIEAKTVDPNTTTSNEILPRQATSQNTSESTILKPEYNSSIHANNEDKSHLITTASDTPTPSQPIATLNQSETNLSDNHDLIIAKNPTTPLQQLLWKDRISASVQTDMSASQNELEQIINQLNAIEIKPQPQASEPETDIQSVTKTEPNDTTITTESQTSLSNESDPAAPDNNASNRIVSKETLHRIKELSQKPNELNNPFQLAEILYHSGCLAEAASCYQTALDRLDNDNPNPPKDKAWILLQLGNCLKAQNPEAAQQKYQTVIKEFPLSPWVRLAQVKSDSIDWFVKDQPEKVLNESRKKITR